MTHRARPRVRLLTGGPSWDERHARIAPTPRRKLPKPQREALKQLDASLAGIKVALRHKQFSLVRQLRRVAWEEVEKLPRHLTGEQRTTLWEAKRKLHLLEEEARQRHRRAN